MNRAFVNNPSCSQLYPDTEKRLILTGHGQQGKSYKNLQVILLKKALHHFSIWLTVLILTIQKSTS